LFCITPQSGGLFRYSAAPLRGWMDQSQIAGTPRSGRPGRVPTEDTAFFIKKDEVQPLRGWMTKSNRRDTAKRFDFDPSIRAAEQRSSGEVQAGSRHSTMSKQCRGHLQGSVKKLRNSLFSTQKVKIFSTKVAKEILWQENQ
jgi:hypothetical protein